MVEAKQPGLAVRITAVSYDRPAIHSLIVHVAWHRPSRVTGTESVCHLCKYCLVGTQIMATVAGLTYCIFHRRDGRFTRATRGGAITSGWKGRATRISNPGSSWIVTGIC